ncbi:hypothetical protein MRX96_054505 [Rhipicephalus microplus]
MPRAAERVQRRDYHLSAMAPTARWRPEQRRVAVPLAASRWGPLHPRPVNSQALRTKESALSVRNSFQDGKLLQKVLPFQSTVLIGPSDRNGEMLTDSPEPRCCVVQVHVTSQSGHGRVWQVPCLLDL